MALKWLNDKSHSMEKILALNSILHILRDVSFLIEDISFFNKIFKNFPVWYPFQRRSYYSYGSGYYLHLVC